MDNAYLHGFDYDSHRNSLREPNYAGQVFAADGNRRGRHKAKTLTLVTLIVIVILGLFFFSLRFIPLFDIESISFTVTGGFSHIPRQAQEMADGIVGESLMTGEPRRLEEELSSLAVVSHAKVKRGLFSSISIDLQIAQPATFVAVVDESDSVEGIYIVENDTLLPIDIEDFKAYGNRVFVVEVGSSYGEHLRSYGLDEGIGQAIALASGMGMDEDGRFRIIGRVKYEESLGKTFGHMVLDMPAYNSKLYIREPVSESRLHDALRLIRLEHEHDWTRNIALIGQLRYDLYAQSLVSRN